jgi:hypothetical protein
MADRYQVRGPRVTDGGSSVLFDTGEYQREEVAELFKRVPPMRVLEVTVKYEE